MSDILLKVDHVSKSYTNHKALDDVSIEIPRGSVYGLLGPNGAGKSTLIRIINQIISCDSGRVLLDGQPMHFDDVRNIGYLPEERGLYKKSKVGEQAIFFARLKGLSRAEATLRLKAWFTKFGIESWWDKRVEELSKGMAQKIQFIIAVLHEPKLLIFDEPFSGFDPISANLLKDEILGLRDRGATVIFSTHNMASVEQICDSITLINKSQNILTGSVSEIRHRYGEDNYRLMYTAEDQSLVDMLSPICQSVSPVENKLGELYPSIDIKLGGADLKHVISQINDHSQIIAFERLIPSMDDIFIRAVNQTL